MHRYRCILAALLMALVAALPAAAQRVDASATGGPTSLDAPWRLHFGDAPNFAQPGFDDSHWTMHRIEKDWASEVGGDFYQVFPRSDGSALVLVGDVSGKGWRAAMLGTLIVGAAGALAQENLAPEEMLNRLNRHLCGRADGGLCARLAPDGALSIANAGNLSPYHNGCELPCASGLPLGIMPESAYPETRVLLNPGDALTFLSDGVVEARSAAGELFGFDRTQEISRQSAEQIADTAARFGQEDDITVLTLSFAPAEVLRA